MHTRNRSLTFWFSCLVIGCLCLAFTTCMVRAADTKELADDEKQVITFGRFVFMALVAASIIFIVVNYVMRGYTRGHLLDSVLAQELLDPHPVTVTSDAALSTVGNMMIEKSLPCIMVVSLMKELDGLISKQRIDKIHRAHRTADGTFKYDPSFVDKYRLIKAMKKDIPPLYIYSSLREVIEAFAESSEEVLPVINKAQHLLGIVSKQDVLRAIHRYRIAPKNIPHYELLTQPPASLQMLEEDESDEKQPDTSAEAQTETPSHNEPSTH